MSSSVSSTPRAGAAAHEHAAIRQERRAVRGARGGEGGHALVLPSARRGLPEGGDDAAHRGTRPGSLRARADLPPADSWLLSVVGSNGGLGSSFSLGRKAHSSLASSHAWS